MVAGGGGGGGGGGGLNWQAHTECTCGPLPGTVYNKGGGGGGLRLMNGVPAWWMLARLGSTAFQRMEGGGGGGGGGGGRCQLLPEGFIIVHPCASWACMITRHA